jgi:hypothetical protein
VFPKTAGLAGSTVATGPVPLAAAVLPSSRSVQVDCPATAFATVINAGTEAATGVSIAPATNVPVNFLYQTTDPKTNLATGTPNTPVDIAAGRQQTFVISLTPTAPFPPTDIAFAFGGSNTLPVPALTGINTLLLSSSVGAAPDIVALVATVKNDGIVAIPSVPGAAAFAVATVNVGATAAITATADTGGVSLPLAIALCQTDPVTAQCLLAAGPSVTAPMSGGSTATFGIFVAATGAVAFDPAAHRIFVRFVDAAAVTRGATSAAVRTP